MTEAPQTEAEKKRIRLRNRISGRKNVSIFLVSYERQC